MELIHTTRMDSELSEARLPMDGVDWVRRCSKSYHVTNVCVLKNERKNSLLSYAFCPLHSTTLPIFHSKSDGLIDGKSKLGSYDHSLSACMILEKSTNSEKLFQGTFSELSRVTVTEQCAFQIINCWIIWHLIALSTFTLESKRTKIANFMKW